VQKYSFSDTKQIFVVIFTLFNDKSINKIDKYLFKSAKIQASIEISFLGGGNSMISMKYRIMSFCQTALIY